MTSKYKFQLLTAIAFFELQCSGMQAERNRDLSSYDNGGAYTLKSARPDSEERKVIAQIRDFLWRHWKQRKLGYVDVTNFGVEGQKTTSRYVIEASQRGVWYIAIDMDSEVITPNRNMAHRRDSFVATVVERVSISDGEKVDKAKSLAEDTVLPADSFQLLLKDESGKLLNGF